MVVVLTRALRQKNRNSLFTIEIVSEQLQRQAEILPWTKAWSGGEGKVQESPVQRTGEILLMGESMQGNVAEGEEKGTKDREAQDPP